jgi:hypothetical protein
MAGDNRRSSSVGRRPRLRFNLAGDGALAGGGVAAALCSLAFAGYMICDHNRRPYFPGGEYLAIFSKPSRGIQVAAHPSPALARLNTRDDPNGVDPTPTGAIPRAMRPEPPDGAGLPPSRYRLVAAKGQTAWVESEYGFRQVKLGESLPGFGHVASIETRNGRWALVTDTGSMLELKEAAPLSHADKEPDGRFTRRMIFDRDAQ